MHSVHTIRLQVEYVLSLFSVVRCTVQNLLTLLGKEEINNGKSNSLPNSSPVIANNAVIIIVWAIPVFIFCVVSKVWGKKINLSNNNNYIYPSDHYDETFVTKILQVLPNVVLSNSKHTKHLIPPPFTLYTQ